MSSIFIDGQSYQVNNKDNILHACLSLGLDVPYFCWHPELGSVGACRQCMVTQYQNEQDTTGKLIVSCMTPIKDKTIITINDKLSKKFRKFIIELLMINHPHDCPVCEEGGQCHLQDMTVMNKHYNRRYRFKKRTYNNQFLGDFIKHEMNRCITCYRCVRYYKDYADGKDFGVYGSKDNIYFGRYKNGYLENEFSGNLIDVCPTGVFTDKINSKHYVRKWDMQFSPSVCQYCSIGCNISIGERYGKIRKIENRYHNSINRYFLCDLGRFGYEHLNLDNRIIYPFERVKNNIIKLKTNQVLKKISEIKNKSECIIGIGSSRASVESNFALLQLVGKNNFSSGISTFEKECLLLIHKIINSNIKIPSLKQIEREYDAILILGEDITQTSPRLALSVRQAIKRKIKVIAVENEITESWNALAVLNNSQDNNNKYPLFITNIDNTKLEDISQFNYHAPVCEQARFGFAIANAIDKKAPKVKNLKNVLIDKIKLIAETLMQAKKPLIISGCHSGNISIIEAAYNIVKALKSKNNQVGINLLSFSCNSLGVTMLGGKSLEEISKIIINNNKKTTLIILENDIYRRLRKKEIDLILKKVFKLIVLDHLNTKIIKYANIALPSANFAETCGTIVNYEGRAQKFFQSYKTSYYNDKNKIQPSWRWLYAIKNEILCKNVCFENILDDISKKYFLSKDIKNNTSKINSIFHNQKIARAPNRYSGRTAMYVDMDIHEKAPAKDLDSIFTYSMEGNNKLNNQYIPFVWSPGWNSIQALNKYQKKIGDDLLYQEIEKHIAKNKQMHYQQKLLWFKNIPSEFNNEKWHFAPYYYLFGSEEITHFSFTIKNIMPKVHIIINNSDAKKLNIDIQNSFIEFNYLEENFCFPIIISEKLKSKQLGLPIGFPNVPMYLINAIIDNFKIKNINKTKVINVK